MGLHGMETHLPQRRNLVRLVHADGGSQEVRAQAEGHPEFLGVKEVRPQNDGPEDTVEIDVWQSLIDCIIN